MGKRSPAGAAWTEKSPCAPIDAYGRSKLEAEGALARVAAGSSLSVCILRAPLVYGPGVGANMARLMRIVRAGWPLPLGGVRNRRSLLYVGNLADAVARCLERVDVSGVFLIRDGEDLSTPELVRRLAQALGRPARVWPVPPALLRWGAACLGRGAAAERLLGDLAVDDALLRGELEWKPPFSMAEGLSRMARWSEEHA